MMVRMARKQLSVVQALGQDRADRRIAILREIGVQGSISQAARVVGVSYKAAWQALDTLTNLAGVALVERVVGGAGGGGARLTQAAHELLAAADTLARERSNAAQGSGAHQAAAQLSVRTSMRNQWPCVVTALRRQGSIVDVVLAARGDEALLALSRITRESAQLLGLAPGLPVQVLCKATAVRVRAGASPDENEPNHWRGRVLRISRHPAGDEVVVQLGGGLQLVGFAPPGSGLRARGAVLASADPSALAIMVSAA